MDKATSGRTLAQAAQLLRRSVVREGKPFPLGATWDGLGVNFALFSAHATKVELCLLDANGETELERIELPEYTDEVWRGYLPAARPGLVAETLTSSYHTKTALDPTSISKPPVPLHIIHMMRAVRVITSRRTAACLRGDDGVCYLNRAGDDGGAVALNGGPDRGSPVPGWQHPASRGRLPRSCDRDGHALGRPAGYRRVCAVLVR
jgi:hypothetical protein